MELHLLCHNIGKGLNKCSGKSMLLLLIRSAFGAYMMRVIKGIKRVSNRKCLPSNFSCLLAMYKVPVAKYLI